MCTWPADSWNRTHRADRSHAAPADRITAHTQCWRSCRRRSDAATAPCTGPAGFTALVGMPSCTTACSALASRVHPQRRSAVATMQPKGTRKPPEPSEDHAPIAAWIKSAMPDLQPILAHLDGQIRKALPGTSYALKWKKAYYGLPDKGWVIELVAYDVSVNVVFFAGAKFDPPRRLARVRATSSCGRWKRQRRPKWQSGSGSPAHTWDGRCEVAGRQALTRPPWISSAAWPGGRHFRGDTRDMSVVPQRKCRRSQDERDPSPWP